MQEFALVAERVQRLGEKGNLAPHYYSPMTFDGGVALFQDAVPGAWSDEVDDELIETALTLNDLQADEGDHSNSWHNYLASTLTEGAAGYCIHDTLRTYSAATRSILDWIIEVGHSLGNLPCGDLVHLDFHHRNMLRVGGRLSAVVDWEGCIPGDRAFDLVTLSFGFTHARSNPGTEELVWKRATEIASKDRLMAYVAHMSLRRLDWTIRHHSAEDVDTVLDVVSNRRMRVA
jgi:hypothetical protein